MTTNAIELRQQQGALAAPTIQPSTYAQAEAFAKVAAASGLFGVKSPEAALSVMLTGDSLGIPAVVALRGIHVINGKAVLSSDLIAAVVRRSGQCAAWRVLRTTPETCTITTTRHGEEPFEHTWTIDMAKRAGLAGRGTWAAYPAAMLRARCTAEIARIVYPDAVAGCYCEGEIPGDTGPVTLDAQAVESREEFEGAPSALGAFGSELSSLETLDAVARLWGRHDAALHDAGHAERAREDLYDRLARLGYALTREHLAAAMRGSLPPALLRLYNALADLEPGETGASVTEAAAEVLRAHKAELGAALWGEAVNAARRTLALLEADDAHRLRDLLASPVAKPTQDNDPNDDGPRGGGSPRPSVTESTDARGTHATSNGADGMVDAIGTTDGEVLSTAADVAAYVGTIDNLPHFEAWCRRNGGHRLALLAGDAIADRLIALDAVANADGTKLDRKAARDRVDAWAKSGPKRRQQATQGRAVQQGKEAA